MKHRSLRRTRAHLDAVLEGRAPAGDPLVDFVEAVRAPALPTELAGLDAALAAFVSASSVAPAPTEETSPMLKSLVGRALALKILAVVAGTAAASGVAYAAVNGSLDTPNDHAAAVAKSHAAGSDDESSSASSSDSSSSSSSASESESESSSAPGSESESPEGSPSPSLKGLCTAWLAHPKNDAKLATNPAFSVLVSAAGGTDAVNGYCTALLATSHPSHPAHPTQAHNSDHGKPSSSTSHGKPTSLPSQAQKSVHATNAHKPTH